MTNWTEESPSVILCGPVQKLRYVAQQAEVAVRVLAMKPRTKREHDIHRHPGRRSRSPLFLREQFGEKLSLPGCARLMSLSPLDAYWV